VMLLAAMSLVRRCGLTCTDNECDMLRCDMSSSQRDYSHRCGGMSMEHITVSQKGIDAAAW
jgi:hypothetical protein